MVFMWIVTQDANSNNSKTLEIDVNIDQLEPKNNKESEDHSGYSSPPTRHVVRGKPITPKHLTEHHSYKHNSREDNKISWLSGDNLAHWILQKTDGDEQQYTYLPVA